MRVSSAGSAGFEIPERKADDPAHRGTLGEMVALVVGTLCLDVLLGDVHSLKQKRSVIRPVVADLRRRFEVAAAETGSQDLHRRCELAVAVVSSTHNHATEVLEQCERLVAGRPELDLLSARIRVLDDDDLQ